MSQQILIVEDETDIRELLRFNLEREGFTVHEAADGTQGLALARQHTPDLVILDVMLPGVDGFEVCRRLGAQAETSHIPVLMVFQKPNPFPKTIYENVAYGLRVNGLRDESLIAEKVELSLRRAAIFEEVKDRLQGPALGLSGGQQQRLCIARALAVEPEVLLMDEPASALDPIATQKIEESIRELRESLSIIIVTHNMQQAARVSDYTAFFYMGRLIEHNATDIMFTRPAKKQTEDYITGRFG